MAKNKRQAEFGDFQTPDSLAGQICEFLAAKGVQPAAVLEPTCGVGALLLAAMRQFPSIQYGWGFDINPSYIDQATARAQDLRCSPQPQFSTANFFDAEWGKLIAESPRPLLILGNPPWVTNSELSTLESENVPTKSNSQNLRGLDALTGKSNFDISEWMLLKMLDWLQQSEAMLAMLCKTSVARRVLAQAWKTGLRLQQVELRAINAAEHFGAAVDACLLYCQSGAASSVPEADCFRNLSSAPPIGRIGLRGDELVADANAYDQTYRFIQKMPKKRPLWRSGIKHDCASVMELQKIGGQYVNRLGESLELEPNYLFPLLKSSDVAGDSPIQPRYWMLVPQQGVGVETENIERAAPRTWDYLQRHGLRLDNRKSSIYRNRPRFSIFGVGDYSFAPWKVAISGFYKRLQFSVISGFEGKPIVFDDTVYFLPCSTQSQAEKLAEILNAPIAQDFLACRVFWDSKRPITVDLLQRLSLELLAEELGYPLSLPLDYQPSRNDAETTKRQTVLF